MLERLKLIPFLRLYFAAALVWLLAAPRPLNCQPPAKPPESGSDVLVFVDGEKLIGHLETSTDKTVTFKSNMAGEITVEWSKIKELHSPDKFAVIEKGVKLHAKQDTSQVPQGTLSLADQTIQLAPPPPSTPITVPVSNTATVVDESTFLKTVNERPGIFQAWQGSATAGIAFVRSTQNSETYTAAVSLTRSIPTESWMDPSNRTIITFDSAYGKLSQPGTATVKTSILHGDAERDQYLSPRVYLFGDAAFDHNYSQGLDLQQTYGGGIGWTAEKRENDELDLKAELDYVNQQFLNSMNNKSFLGSIFSESYNRTFTHKIVFHEQIGFAPAWTDTRAYSAIGNMSLTIPVIKRIGVTMSALDTFLNDPSPGFKKNSFAFTTGVTYTLPK